MKRIIITPEVEQCSFSRGSNFLTSKCVCAKLPQSCLTRYAPLSTGFSRQGYWSGLHFLLQGIFLTQGLNLQLLQWQILYHGVNSEAL